MKFIISSDNEKIESKKRHLVFSDLDCGDMFTVPYAMDARIYIRTESIEDSYCNCYNAVDIENGECIAIDGDTMVSKYAVALRFDNNSFVEYI